MWRSLGEAYHPNCCMPRVQHGGGSVMVWTAISWHSLGPILVLDEHVTAKDTKPFWRTMRIQWFKHCILKAMPCIRMTMHQYIHHRMCWSLKSISIHKYMNKFQMFLTHYSYCNYIPIFFSFFKLLIVHLPLENSQDM